MHMIISFINIKSIKLRQIICGKPSILIYRGKIDEIVLRKERFTVNELQERLWGNNIFNISDVEYAILETNGEVTVIQKPDKKNLTLSDMGIQAQYEGLPYDLVVDGKVMYENLKKLGKDYNWLKKQLKDLNATPEEILLATIDGKNEIFCQKKENKNV